MLCKRRPKLVHALLNGAKNVGRNIAIAINAMDAATAHHLGSADPSSGQNPMPANRIAKTIPKDRSEELLIF